MEDGIEMDLERISIKMRNELFSSTRGMQSTPVLYKYITVWLK
jgi:hypothetical protein